MSVLLALMMLIVCVALMMPMMQPLHYALCFNCFALNYMKCDLLWGNEACSIQNLCFHAQQKESILYFSAYIETVKKVDFCVYFLGYFRVGFRFSSSLFLFVRCSPHNNHAEPFSGFQFFIVLLCKVSSRWWRRTRHVYLTFGLLVNPQTSKLYGLRSVVWLKDLDLFLCNDNHEYIHHERFCVWVSVIKLQLQLKQVAWCLW